MFDARNIPISYFKEKARTFRMPKLKDHTITISDNANDLFNQTRRESKRFLRKIKQISY